MGDIYIIRNTINDKVYIGQSICGASARFKQHVSSALRGDTSCPALYNAMRKYGVENFYYEILEHNVPNELLNDREVFYVSKYDSYHHGYNATTGGDGRLYAEVEDSGRILWMSQCGFSNKSISEILEIPQYRVAMYLKKRGYKQPDVIKLWVLRYVKEGWTTNQIANYLDIPIGRVQKIRRENGCKNPKCIPIRERVDTNALTHDYMKGMTDRELAAKYGLSPLSIRSFVRSGHLGNTRNQKITTEIDTDMVVTDYYLGMTHQQMTSKYQISRQNLQKILSDRNVWAVPTILHNGGKIYYGKRMKSKTKNRKWGYGIVILPVDHIDNETKVEVDE